MAVKRVLFIDPVGERGGAEVVLRDIVRGLNREKFEPLVALLRPGPFAGELRGLGVPTFELGAHKTRQLHRVWQATRELGRIVARERIDLLHCNGNTMLLYGAQAARVRACPCVWHVHDPLAGRGAFERAFIVAQRRLQPAWTIFGTPAVAPSFLQTYRNIGRHDTVLAGVAAEDLAHGADAARGRRALNLNADAPLIAMFSRLQKFKGHLDLVEAAAQVVRAHPDARFVACGGSLFGLEPEYPAEVERAIEAHGLKAHFSMLGYVSDQARKDILAAATIVAHPARVEPLGLAVLEGMAMSKPIVAADAVGPSTTVLSGETGLLFPAGDVPALAQALCTLLDDAPRAIQMGRCGHKRVLQEFTVQTLVRRVEGIYDQVLS